MDIEAKRDNDKKRQAEYRAANREDYNRNMREWRERNKERVNRERRERRASDPEYAARVRAAERNSHDPKKHKNTRLKSTYGITLEEYDSMRVEQDFKCAICGKHESLNATKCLVVDHNHTTQEVRGLLCYQCNAGIGMLQESADIMLRALEYLDKFKEN